MKVNFAQSVKNSCQAQRSHRADITFTTIVYSNVYAKKRFVPCVGLSVSRMCYKGMVYIKILALSKSYFVFSALLILHGFVLSK
jgi:hypothetical protein